MQQRSRARRQALQILYQRDITGQSVAEILAAKSYSLEDGEPDEFCRHLVGAVESRLDELDATIGEVSENWAVSRMPLVDRNILRVATYEIECSEDVPASVAINEAVELAKVYGGEDSSKFVNGVLGRIAKNDEVHNEQDATDD